MRVAVIILNHNLPEYTDQLYDMLSPHSGDLYSLDVLDNGSPAAGRSRHTSLETGENRFFGGGLNFAFRHVLERPGIDYLLFLNNDLIVPEARFVATLVEAADENAYAVVSPCILQPEREQNFWPVMHCWGSRAPRETGWVDFTAPLIHRRLIEAIGQYDAALEPGYGCDLYAGLVCRDRGWKIAVCDNLAVVHIGSLTLKLGRSSLTQKEHHELAKQRYVDYFARIGRFAEMEELRRAAKQYRYRPEPRRTP